jgi:predicted thioredoxin/glutaredoxin
MFDIKLIDPVYTELKSEHFDIWLDFTQACLGLKIKLPRKIKKAKKRGNASRKMINGCRNIFRKYLREQGIIKSVSVCVEVK